MKLTYAYVAVGVISFTIGFTAGIFWGAMFAVTLGASAFLLWQFRNRDDVFGGPLSDNDWNVRR